VKNILKFAFVFALIFASASNLYAVDSTSSDMISADTEGVVDTKPIEVSVGSIVLDKKSYKSGETIVGSFLIKNTSGYIVNNLSFRTLIATDYNEPAPGVKISNSYLDGTQRSGSFKLNNNETKRVDFSYKIPDFINGTKLGVAIDLFSEAGHVISFGDSDYITIVGKPSSVEILNAELKLSNGKKFNLSEGPMIYSNREPSGIALSVELSNKSTKVVTIVPKVKVYQQSDVAKDVILDTKPILLNPTKSQTVNIDLPTMNYVAGVYFAEVILHDEAGSQLTSLIGARYIVGGDIATIHNVSIDKTSLSKGDQFEFVADISGRPFDIAEIDMVGKVSVGEYGKVVVRVLNEKDAVVYEGEEAFSPMGETNISKKFTSLTAALATRVELSVYNSEGKLLTEYKSNLSEKYEEIKNANPKESDYMMHGIVILIVVLVLIMLLIIKKKMNANKIAALSIFILGSAFFGTGNVFAAAPDCSPASISLKVVEPISNTVFAPGADIYLKGTIGFKTCANSFTKVDMRVTVVETGVSYPYPRLYTKGGSGSSAGWVSGSTKYLVGPVKAPTTAGSYTMKATAGLAVGICSKFSTVLIPFTVEGESIDDGGGVKWCPYGSFYCETLDKCIPDGQACNAPGIAAPDPLNPLIPRLKAGPVKLKPLTPKPTIVNKGDSCVISWQNSFTNYDRYTVCEFTGPNVSPVSFSPSTTDRVDYTTVPLTSTTIYKMSCHQVDDKGVKEAGTTKSTEAVCRLNVNYKEVN
jgi:hypothetical protein